MNIAIIEDDQVERLVYHRQFEGTEFVVTFFENFRQFEHAPKDFDFLISDYYINDETVEEYLHFFMHVPGIIVSNASPTSKIAEAKIMMKNKPLILEEFRSFVYNNDAQIEYFKEIDQVTRFTDFCDTMDEVNEFIMLLNENIIKAINELKNNERYIHEKYFYHNLINQIQYFKKNDLDIEWLRNLEQQVFNGRVLDQQQVTKLIEMLKGYSQTLKNLSA